MFFAYTQKVFGLLPVPHGKNWISYKNTRDTKHIFNTDLANTAEGCKIIRNDIF